MRIQNKPNVLLLSPLPPPVGGIASWTINLLHYISYKKINNIDHLNTAIRFKRITSNSTIIRIISGALNFIYVFSKIIYRIIFHKPDAIHLTSSASLGLFSDNALIILAQLFHIPVITHWRFGRIPTLAEQQNWEWKLLCHVIHKSKTAIVIDEKSFTTLVHAGFTNIVNIPNPISLDVENKIKHLIDHDTTRNNGRIIFVGHVIKNKGIFELVEVCLTNQSINELVIVGPYEEDIKKELLNLASQRNNGTWLKLVGALDKDQVLIEMRKSLILALPSYTEGFPNVVIEGMAMGCAVIATDVGAIPEMIDWKSKTPCGICVPVKNVTILKKVIDDLIENPIKSEIIGNRGIKKVLNNYTLEKIVIQYQNIWEQVL